VIIKLQPEQIVTFWEGIKHSLVSVNQVPDEIVADYTNNELVNLLSGLSQCWLIFSYEGDEKFLHAIMTTRIFTNHLYGGSVFSVSSLYGYRSLTEELIKEGFDAIREFARVNNCSMIIAESSNDRVNEILLGNNFEPFHVIYRSIL
jgi:hypothetical protein